MMRKTRTTLLGLVVLVVFACLLLVGCAGVTSTVSAPTASAVTPSLATGQPTEIQAIVPQNGMTPIATTTPAFKSSETLPINVKLAISHPPRLGETAYLTVTVVSVFDAPNSNARIELPADAILLAGSLRWQGSLTAKMPVQFSVAIKFSQIGEKEIRAAAASIRSATSSVGDVDAIILDVWETSGQFHVYDPRTPHLIEKILPDGTRVLVNPDPPTLPSGTPPTAMPQPTGSTSTLVPPAHRSEALPINVKLAISHPPRLGETAYLTVTVVSVFDAPNSNARIELPADAILLAGSLRWQGSLMAKMPVQFSVAVKFGQIGEKEIRAAAASIRSATSSVGDVDAIILDVWGTSGQFHVYDPRTPHPIEKILPDGTRVLVTPDSPTLPSGTPPTAMPQPPANRRQTKLESSAISVGQLMISGRWYRYERNGQQVGVAGCLVMLYTGAGGFLQQSYTCSV